MSKIRLLLISLLLVVGMGSVVHAQGLGPDMYGLPSEFGMGIPVSARELGMGTPITCIPDVPFANAGFAAVLTQPDAEARYTTTTFDHGPHLVSLETSYFQPIRPGHDGAQLTIMDLSGAAGETNLGAPVTARMSERGWVVDYGHRFGRKFTAGLSILGADLVGMSFDTQQGPLMDLRSTSDWGGRYGMTYEWVPGDYLGLIYSFSQDHVPATGMAVGGAVSPTFHNGQFGIGASRHLTPKLLAAVEYQRGTTWGSGVDDKADVWHYGAEYQLGSGWALRAGAADHSPTFGLGYAQSRWRFDYAYISDWNDSDVSPLFGSSRTHSLNAIYEW